MTSYVLSLKTTIPEKRPDGRRESAIAYEWRIQLPESHSPLNEKSGRSNEVLDFEVAWDDLEPMYRGRPKKDAPKFKPEEVKEWSIMARSDFGVSARGTQCATCSQMSLRHSSFHPETIRPIRIAPRISFSRLQILSRPILSFLPGLSELDSKLRPSLLLRPRNLCSALVIRFSRRRRRPARIRRILRLRTLHCCYRRLGSVYRLGSPTRRVDPSGGRGMVPESVRSE